MLNVGITGNIGSGKTTVCKLFAIMGVPVYYADERGRAISNENIEVVKKVKALLGSDIYTENQELKRSAVAEIVFNDSEKLAALNAIIHPAVAEDSNKWFAEQTGAGKAYALKEAALLVENGSYKHLDKLIVVSAPLELRLDRVMSRDKTKRDQVEARMKNQLGNEEKEKVADFVIVNDGKEALIPQVLAIHKELTNKYR